MNDALLSLEARLFVASCDVKIDVFADRYAAEEFIAVVLAGEELELA